MPGVKETDSWTQDEEIDYDKVADGPPPPLEPGVYRFEVAAASAKGTKNDNGALRLELTITGKYGSDEKIKRRMYDNIVVTLESAWRIKAFAKAVGLQPPKRTGMAALEDFAAEATGAGGWLKSKLEEFKGKVNHKPDAYLLEDQIQEALSSLGGSSGSDASSAVADRPARKSRKAAASA